MPDGQATADYELRTLKVSEISIGRDNPRRIDPKSADIAELAGSIAASGVIEPVHVRRVGKGGSKGGGGELLAGERRLVAAKVAGAKTVPVIDHGTIGDDAAFEITFLENFGRKDLTVMEESLAVKMCMIKFGSSAKVAERLGKSVRWVETRANIQKGLSDNWKKAITEELPLTVWPASHIALIARLPAHIQDECLDNFQYDDEVITLSEVEAKLASRARLLDKAPWNMDAKGLNGGGGKVPPCSKCPKCSSVQPGLWDPPAPPGLVAKNDRCLDIDCWDKKLVGYLKGLLKELKGQYGQVICLASKYPEMAYTLKSTYGDFSLASDFSVVKKPADDRTAALIVYGAGIGEVRWVKAKAAPSSAGDSATGGSSGGSGSGTSKSTGSVTPKPKTLKERRKLLDSKRWFVVLTELAEKIEAATVDDITVEDKTLFLIAVAATFGADKKVFRPGDGSWDGLKKRLDGYCLAETTEAAYRAAQEDMLRLVKPELTDHVSYCGPITQVPKYFIDAAKIIAGYLGIDIKAMFAKQAEAIKEPAGWKNLKADGTPKKNKKK